MAIESTSQSRFKVRQMFSRIGAPKSAQAAVLDPLIRILKTHHPKADIAIIERAYRTAEHYHLGQTRKNGDPFITHPLAVTTILAELGMNEATLCAALLHDTVEDTSYTLEQLKVDFGEEIAQMVDGVTKLDKIKYGESAKAETIRKMVVAMARDIRVLIIKLADRLHNMRTLHYLRPDKQERIAKDTIEIFAPLAHRLGMNAIKWELEDLSFATMQPKIYDEIVKLVAQRAPLREEFIHTVTAQVKEDLAAAGIKATVYGRPKHYYSIYQKMVVRGRDFFDIYDLVGLRILVDTERDCYATLGALHARWAPLPGRFKDYIAMPKVNLYQSLHTTVVGPNGKPVEFQIRTHEMHRHAEFGVAAHWKYKEGKAKGAELSWVHQIQLWQKETEDPEEFLDTFKFEIGSDDVFVFTPKGDVTNMPNGATPVDFAYSVHTEVGHRCIGARVNGKLVPLDSQLSSGDVVEILTSKSATAGPSRDWLSFVKTPRARQKIKQHFTRERREESIEQGREILAKYMRRSGLPLQKLLTPDHMAALIEYFRVSDEPSLWAGIGEGAISPQAVVTRLVGDEGGVEAVAEVILDERTTAARIQRAKRLESSGVQVDGDPGMWVKLAKCCTPVPGDEILGFVTRGSGVSVHRDDCPNAGGLKTQPERLVNVAWDSNAISSYLVAIQIEAIDRTALLADIAEVVGQQRLSLTSMNASASKDMIFKARLSCEVPSPQQVEQLINSLKRIDGVYDVYRVRQS